MSKSRSGAPRRVAAGLVASALTVVGFALAPPAGAVDDVAADRVAGINRYGTAAAVAGQPDFDGATTAILATGETFPDALAASGLAGSNNPAPIILTQSDAYASEAEEALNNLTSISDVIIVGGTAAVSQSVEDAVEADGFNVSRVAGVDRYGTAAAIGEAIGTIGEIDGLVTAFIATGTGFADALAGGPLSYDLNSPILLVQPTDIPSATSSALTDLGIEQVVILGGTAAVSDDVEAELEDIVGNDAIRVAGVNRFGTAAAVGEYAVTELGWAPVEVLLANGLNFPDALAGGPLGGERDAPIILTSSLPEESRAFLDLHSDTITNITALGGTAAIDSETLEAAEAAAEDTADDEGALGVGVTSRPELVGASIVQTITATTTTPGNPPGTTFRYTFDEPITGAAPVLANFKVWTSAGVATTGGAGDSVIVDPNDSSSALLFIDELDTAAEVSGMTLATVLLNAVTDIGTTNRGNPEGDASLTPASSTPATAGTTVSPDLVSVGGFRAGSTADVTAVDFTFDEAAFVEAGAAAAVGFSLIGTNGTRYPCTAPASGSTATLAPGGGSVPGGNGTTVITVTCEEFGAHGAGLFHTATNIARGVVSAGTVDDTIGLGGNTNPLHAAEAAAGGNSSDPDLDSIIFLPDITTGFDTALYTFDEAVAAGATANRFRSYDAVTGSDANAGIVATQSSTNPAQYAILFGDGTLANDVGGSVRANAVTDLQGAVNEEDEVSATPAAGSSVTAARTDGPDLISVTQAQATDAFGQPQGRVTYSYDEDTTDPVPMAAGTIDNMHLYLADGTRLNCSAIANNTPGIATQADRAEDADHQVVCTAFVISNADGTNGTTAATVTQIMSGVLGTVEAGAVFEESGGGLGNPEGAEATSGGTGTPSD